MIRTTASFFICACCAISVATANATIIQTEFLPVELNIVGSVEGQPTQVLEGIETSVNSDGTFLAADRTFGEGGDIWVVDSLSISGNVDPFVDLDFTITNVASSPADIVVSAVVPIVGSFPGPNAIFGEIVASVTDTDGDGSVSFSSTGGGPVFTGTVDGAGELDLLVTSLTLGAMPGGTVFVGSPTDTDILSTAATSTIGIDIVFTLGAGDSATIDSFFSLEPVPEPMGLSLLMVGVGIAASRRCR